MFLISAHTIINIQVFKLKYKIYLFIVLKWFLSLVKYKYLVNMCLKIFLETARAAFSKTHYERQNVCNAL